MKGSNKIVFPFSWKCWEGFWGNIGYIPRNIKWCWQRAMRGWAEVDAWQASDYSLEVLIGMMKYLDKYSHGYPSKFRSDKEYHDWLRRMIHAGSRMLDIARWENCDDDPEVIGREYSRLSRFFYSEYNKHSSELYD